MEIQLQAPSPQRLQVSALDLLSDDQLLALVLERDTGVLERDTGVLERDTGVLERDTGVLERDTGVLERDTGVLEPDTGEPASMPSCVADRTRELFAAHGPLRRLSTRSQAELAASGAIGRSDARRLTVVFALARRIMQAKLEPGVTFLSPQQIFDHYHATLRDRKREMFLVVLLDARHRILREEIVSEGSLTTSIVHPREVFAAAVRESAGAMVLVHNHPSGDPSPSDEDIAVTRRLVDAADLLGIRILDHVIVGDGEYASFKEVGLL